MPTLHKNIQNFGETSASSHSELHRFLASRKLTSANRRRQSLRSDNHRRVRHFYFLVTTSTRVKRYRHVPLFHSAQQSKIQTAPKIFMLQQVLLSRRARTIFTHHESAIRLAASTKPSCQEHTTKSDCTADDFHAYNFWYFWARFRVKNTDIDDRNRWAQTRCTMIAHF